MNPGHAWEFAGELLDFLVSDTFHRSARQIDFPGRPLTGSPFRVRVYGDRPGRFYDETGVHFWLPRGLVNVDNRQIDVLAGHGNGKVYVALLNQSFREEDVVASLDTNRVSFGAAPVARRWVQNAAVAPVPITGGELRARVPAKGIVAFAVADAAAHLGLQAKLLDRTSRPLGPRSAATVAAPFGHVNAMLLSPDRGLTTAFVYTDARPENVIAATLRCRQGDGPWQEFHDAIFPYEFSPEFEENAGDLQVEFLLENARQEMLRAPGLTLSP